MQGTIRNNEELHQCWKKESNKEIVRFEKCSLRLNPKIIRSQSGSKSIAGLKENIAKSVYVI